MNRSPRYDIIIIGTGMGGGTLRFGEDPVTSVLTPHCQSHEVDNLYVVDTSFFPSSGATNPALTVAAQALRVADHLTGKKDIGAERKTHGSTV
ncbi:MAG: GMC family oxidoreductase [Trueperaceae bacterium]|nr:MAG: GMC family oxidoreductase [Trueperaceae bacterium]